jgi:hypothetical protein
MKKSLLETALNKGNGILRLAPNWVPRSFCIPGRRLKLHPDDYYSLGASRGGIDERWFASTTKADNGPGTPEDEGLSYIYCDDGHKNSKVLLREAIELMGTEILGSKAMKKHGGWTMYSKFFDNLEPLPLHLHQDDKFAARVGRKGKPEGYYFPKQLNNHDGCFPHTYFGLNPGTTKDAVYRCLKNWDRGDNGILNLSRAYRLVPGTGWDVPPGLLHAPGSLLTYEPQRASDVFAHFQSLTWNKYIPRDFLVKDVPEEHHNDIDYLVEMIDWELNTDPNFYENRFLSPVPVKPLKEMKASGYTEYHVVHNSPYFSATELTVFPGSTVTIRDKDAYGVIVVQGRGNFGTVEIESPAMIRFGQMTGDELFVSYKAASAGISIKNTSQFDDLVMLKHFGPGA